MTLSAILLAFAAFLGLAMELYKKTLRKDKAGELEIKGVALSCSAVLGFVTFRIVAGTGLDGGLNPNGYLIVLYTIAIYLLQLPACMAFWKPLLKRFMERKADG
jgi:hypothetical protein